uniref:ABC transporter permease n=1 Tax=Ignisphaera aggregans TaxID=334771 RepID=A0A7C4H2A3_9CREN
MRYKVMLQFLLDIAKLSLKVLSERKLRSTLTIIGIAIGPLALVMISSVIDGYSDYVISQIERIGQNAIVLFPNSGYRFTESDLNIIRSIDGVSRGEPFYSIRSYAQIGGEDKLVFVYALPIDIIFEAFGGLEVEKGSLPTDAEFVNAAVGYKIAYKDGENIYDVGDVISITYLRVEGGRNTIRRAYIMVSAVLKEFGGAFILSPDTTIFMTLEAGRRVFGLNDWSGVIILARSSSDVPVIVRELQSLFRNSAEVISFQGIASIVSSITGAMSFISFASTLSAFAVAVAGVSATMITSVVERTREIGVMKAIGFTDWQILIMILMESIVMSLIGGFIGISIGVVGGHILASVGFEVRASQQALMVIRASPKFAPSRILVTIALTIVIGIVGGIFPAYRASKIPPAVALRYE